MATFWRTYNNKLYDIGQTDQLGFSISDPSYIPDEYLEQQNFVILRTCFGIGDWGIISAMPRKLKERYPDCKVWIPSPRLLKSMFGHLEQNWSSWDDPFQVVHTIFDNNPWIDGFIDSFEEDVFNDHYRIYSDKNEPLLEQILRFWQFNDINDIQPELYFSKQEQELGNSIIKHHVGNSEFGCFLLSNRYNYESDNVLINELNKFDVPYFYWTKDPIEMTRFNFINKALNMRNIDTRIQLYIKSKAKVNIGNQTGMTQLVTRYSPVIELQRQFPIGSNIVENEILISDPIKVKLLKNVPDKWESKTTTSLKFKSELIDFFNKSEYKNLTALEVGSSTGYTTRILSNLFNQVTAVDVLPDRHEYSRNNVNFENSNITYIIADVYNEKWMFGHHDVVLIDCIHTYQHVKQDILNAIELCNKPILVFDDYGLFPEIKQAIDEFIDNGQFEVLRYIGHHSGTIIPKTQNKILKHYEGIICQVK